MHGWREFFEEIGIIVIGVLIALGAEHLVEEARWREDVSKFREAVVMSLAVTRGRLKAKIYAPVWKCLRYVGSR